MSFSVVTILSNLWPQLHAAAEADAVFWTQDELIRHIADASKRLVQKHGVRIVRDITSVTLSQGVAVYNTPPRHLSTLHVAYLGRELRPASTTELERRDRNYQTTQATADLPIRRWYQDKNNQNHIGLYPVPGVDDDAEKLEVEFHQYICGPHIDLADPIIDAPLWVGDYLEVCALVEAYGREGDAQMPESAQAYAGLRELYEQIASGYWSNAQ